MLIPYATTHRCLRHSQRQPFRIHLLCNQVFSLQRSTAFMSVPQPSTNLHRTYQCIDPQVLMSAVKDDASLFCRLLATFLRITPVALEQLQHAIAANDFTAIAQHSHALKSSCCLVGASVLTDILQETELQAKESSFEPSAVSHYLAISEEFQRVSAEVNRCLQEFSCQA